jgi:predicted deacetylase
MWHVRPSSVTRLRDHAELAGLSPIANGQPTPLLGAERAASGERRRIAVAIHDIEPATFERAALVRDWLDDHGVDRVTLLVIPARDLHPLGERSPEMADWLIERRRLGDSIAQHGFQHLQLRRGAIPRRAWTRARSDGSAEFVGLDGDETRRAVDAGWRVLKLAGIQPDGFVAPAYAYTPALRRVLPSKFRWWASLLRLHGSRDMSDESPRQMVSPAWGTSRNSPMARMLAPSLIRTGSLLCGETMRLDLHPADLQYPRYMMALEWVLGRAGGRRHAITYDELLGAGLG